MDEERIARLEAQVKELHGYIQKLVNALIEFYPPMKSILRLHFYNDVSGFNYSGIVEEGNK